MLESKCPQGDNMTSVLKQTEVGAKHYQEYHTTQSIKYKESTGSSQSQIDENPLE